MKFLKPVQFTVTGAAGVATPLKAKTFPVHSALFEPLPANTDLVTWGDSISQLAAVSAALLGEQRYIKVDLAQVYIKTTVNGEGVIVTCMVEA